MVATIPHVELIQQSMINTQSYNLYAHKTKIEQKPLTVIDEKTFIKALRNLSELIEESKDACYDLSALENQKIYQQTKHFLAPLVAIIPVIEMDKTILGKSVCKFILSIISAIELTNELAQNTEYVDENSQEYADFLFNKFVKPHNTKEMISFEKLEELESV
jgi:hypothetical protein